MHCTKRCAAKATLVVSMAILIVHGVNEEGKREMLSIEPMLEESKESYKQLCLKSLKSAA
jgi:transposase-like protein